MACSRWRMCHDAAPTSIRYRPSGWNRVAICSVFVRVTPSRTRSSPQSLVETTTWGVVLVIPRECVERTSPSAAVTWHVIVVRCAASEERTTAGPTNRTPTRQRSVATPAPKRSQARRSAHVGRRRAAPTWSPCRPTLPSPLRGPALGPIPTILPHDATHDLSRCKGRHTGPRTVQLVSDDQQPRPDPTRVGDQPALRTRSGSNWLAWGAVTTVLVAAVMVLMGIRQPAVGWPALVVVVVLFFAMVVVRGAVRPLRTRLVTLAALDLGIVAVGLAAVLVVLVTAPG